jgi:hypothetical protein
VHLVEEKVFAQLSDEKKTEHRRWVLDTGATNHMMGCGSTFSELDWNIRGTVKFRDGSVVQIEGWGQFCSNARMASIMRSLASISFPS